MELQGAIRHRTGAAASTGRELGRQLGNMDREGVGSKRIIYESLRRKIPPNAESVTESTPKKSELF